MLGERFQSRLWYAWPRRLAGADVPRALKSRVLFRRERSAPQRTGRTSERNSRLNVATSCKIIAMCCSACSTRKGLGYILAGVWVLFKTTFAQLAISSEPNPYLELKLFCICKIKLCRRKSVCAT